MLEGRNFLSSPSVVFLNESKQYFDENLKLLLDTDFYHRMRWENGMPHIIENVLVANRDHDDRISSHQTSQYDVIEHPEGNWMINRREHHYVQEKHSDFAITGSIPMRIDLKEATFIIPIRIESTDRLRNVITSTAFLLENFDTNIIIKEVDSKSVFQEYAMPILEEICNVPVDINHQFEKSEEPLFHRQRVLNEMIMEAKTSIVVNYDCDVILPIESYEQAYNSILEAECQVVYPYGQGMYQQQVQATDEVVSHFLETSDFDFLEKNSKLHTSDFDEPVL